MCNLYRMTKNKDEVARWFDAVETLGGANYGEEVYPGTPGVVVAEGRLQAMNWGFPLQMTGKGGKPLKPKPVNNTRSEKLESFFWRFSFEERRCLIPVTAWAEAEGERGAKTRTWLSRPDAELFACAGIWHHSDEWGDCYSMVMTESCGAAAGCHERMPVLLAQEDWGQWTSGALDEARALCVPWEGPLRVGRTSEPWSGGGQTRLL